ncbi:MAG TPA: hypothetical protein VFW90_04445 [Candidatus Saccharimonadales bacterium]|nr:hypothetical protein [Candidatus Saccharimonadales bacterium]
MAEDDSEDKIEIELKVPKEKVDVSVRPTKSESEHDETSEKKETKSSPEDSDEDISEESNKESELKSDYSLGDIAKAPVEPPEPEDTSKPNKHQKSVIVFGFALLAVSIIMWPLFNFAVFIGVALAGAAVVAFGSFVRV